MNKASAFFICVLVLLYSGCASLSETKAVNPSPYYDQIKEGVSNKQDVRAILGEPTNIAYISYCEEWAYGCFKDNKNFYPITIKFNQTGIVTYKSLGNFDLSWPPKQPMRTYIKQTDISHCSVCGKPISRYEAQNGPFCTNHSHSGNSDKSINQSNLSFNEQSNQFDKKLSAKSSLSLKSKPPQKVSSSNKSQLLTLNYGEPLSIDYKKVIIGYLDERQLSDVSANITFRPPCPGWIKEQPWESNGKEAVGYIVFACINGKDYLCMFRNNRLVKVLTPDEKPWIRLKPE